MIDVAPSSLLRFHQYKVDIKSVNSLCSLNLPKSFNIINVFACNKQKRKLPRLIWPTLYVSCARTADFSDNLFTVYIYRPAPLRRLHDSGAGYKYSDLLTYFPAVVWPRVWPCQRDGIHLSGPCCLKDCENIRKRFFSMEGL